jgi:glutathione synthase/RimK-type ligase-like ATP-grasp enzyme
MAILFVSGVNDRSVVGVDLDDQGRLGYVVEGNCSIQYRLPLKEGGAVPFMIFGKGIRQPDADFEQTPSLIFNQIADADTHRGSLERCLALCDQVNTTVINHPRHILQTGRDRVSNLLQDIPGIIMPRTRRFRPRSPEEVLSYAASEGFDFPFIARVAGEHHGKSMVKVDAEADLSSLHALPFDGRDFYLTEYIDYCDENGMYHKQRIVVIDGEPVLRHSLYTDNWMVHAGAREFMMQRESWEDDIARFDRLSGEVIPALREAIDEITNRLKLEYYGIDCCLMPDGQMLIFEANAIMNVLHSPNPAARYRVEAIEQKLYTLLTKYSGEKVI